MLFNSLPFILGFFPVTVVGFFLLGRKSRALAGFWLAGASLFFYGWWNVSFVGLLVGSVLFNYGAGYFISNEVRKPGHAHSRAAFAVAVSANLLLLGYFKYLGFFAQIADALFGSNAGVGAVILPLGISFFTFTQIAFLADAFQGKVREPNFVHYLLFVTYFPHLIAGPILHHSQMMPQFAERRIYRVDWANVSAGLTIFIIGLAKKVLVADTFATIATPVFAGVQQGAHPPLFEAWTGALAYTLQLYFDFSGYSDMAIGLSLFFNVRLPLNFNSPYKATNMIDFWRRWHMTLSAFLREYLYIPLGGNRKGNARRYINLMATMLLGGLWHGAGWTFVVWGGLHGVYLVINHAFRSLRQRLGWGEGRFGQAGALAATALTFASVVVAWVFFRSASFGAAKLMLQGMTGGFGLRSNGVSFPLIGMPGRYVAPPILAGLLAVWLLPNTQEFMRAFQPALGNIARPAGAEGRVLWHPARWWAWSSAGVLFALSLLSLSPTRVSEFLYYQF